MGLWYSDTDQQRYEHICTELDRYVQGCYDYRDLQWHIQSAVIGHLYVSKDVVDLGASAWKTMNAECKTILNDIKTNHKTSSKNLVLHEYCNGKLVTFDHAVPTKVYLIRMIDLYKTGLFTFDKFIQLRSKLDVCIITIDENNRLNVAKLKQSMPPSSDWENVPGDEFARYDAVGINLY